MASVAQIQANRSNARKSTGPRTPQGKTVASQNAVKHGLLAEQVVIKGEDPAQFDLYREGMLDELAPVGAVEAMLAERAVSLSWRLLRAERLQGAVFATVYRENANDVVLWPKHGLPIQPGPGEDEVVLGQVVITDFARAQVLDRLLVYERRIESSLYRTMAQLRKEREARQARATAAQPKEVLRSEGSLPAGQESAAPAELASFGAESSSEGTSSATCQALGGGPCDFTLQTSHFKLQEKITPYGVTTNPPAATVSCHCEASEQVFETNPIMGGPAPCEEAAHGSIGGAKCGISVPWMDGAAGGSRLHGDCQHSKEEMAHGARNDFDGA
ncbi:MAG: hypothetical protein KBE65_18795 [Phycisphaerae bacterium]|nr:hypothetical protein [Phycisphaerae bacterium]